MPAIERILRVTTDERGPLVVLLHGFAGLPEDLEPFARSIGLGARFVFPEGPADLAPLGLRGRAWWRSDGSGRAHAAETGEARDLRAFEPLGLAAAHEECSRLLDVLAVETGSAPLILGGFSQGAMLAFDIALQSERALRGLVQLSGARIAERRWNPRMAARAGTPVFMSHGRQDRDLSFVAAEAFAGDLVAAGWDVDFCAFDGGHEVPLQALRGLKRFLLRQH